jgi:hypothetical protein
MILLILLNPEILLKDLSPREQLEGDCARTLSLRYF